jgi:uncharacterized protein (AIM24 family)/predicted RNA-binding Zn-ribbon protein involved in translation (DUF1610 family)
MFCTNCGSQVQSDAAFCISCGNKIDPSIPPADVTSKKAKQRAQSFVQAPDEVAGSAAPGRIETCPWCGWSAQSASAATRSCPQCGAALQVRSAASRSGWLKLPPRKDMAKLQFGNSSCQIEGLYVPVAEMNLAADGSVYFSHHVLLWVDPAVKITTMSMRGGWKRMFAGMPLIMTQAQGPGHIAFSKDKPGELIALPLQPGQGVDVREHMFLTATSNVEYDWFQSQIWYQVQAGDDTETHHPVGMFMDRFSSPASPGLLLLHAGGSVLVRELAASESILVKPSALIFKDPLVQMQLHFEHPGSGMLRWGSWTNRSIWLRLIGPGRVAIQSVFERAEHEGASIVSHSYATSQQW